MFLGRVYKACVLPVLGGAVLQFYVVTAQGDVVGNGLGTSVTGASAFSIGGGTKVINGANSNLFHSFSQFNLTSAQSATFSDTPIIGNTVQNVIGRISGAASSINGTVGMAGSLPSANLYLINPAGFVFGSNASLNVPGSFHAASASTMTIGGATFGFSTSAATLSGNSSFASASPSAFGFLGNTAGNISVTGSNLTVDDFEDISLVADNVTLNGADLVADGGQIKLVAVGNTEPGTGTVSISSGAPVVSGFTTQGNISITNGSEVFVSDLIPSNGQAAGDVYIRGGSLTMSGSTTKIAASNDSNTSYGGLVDIRVTGAVSIDDSEIFTVNWGDVDAPNNAALAGVYISAGSVSMTNTSRIETNSAFSAAGGGPNLYISAPTVSLDNSKVSTRTFGSGDAGLLEITGATSVVIDNNSEVISDTSSTGQAGEAWVTGGAISILNGSTVQSKSTATGAGAGQSNRVAIRGTTSILVDNATVSTETIDGGAASDGWLWFHLSDNTGTGTITNGAQVIANTTGDGDAGPIYIQRGNWTISDGTGETLVSASSTGAGSAGDIFMGLSFTSNDRELSSLVINDGAEVKTDTVDGPGGSIAITILDTGTGEISGGAKVSANTSGSGNAGDINIGNIVVNNGITNDLSEGKGSWTLNGASTSISTNQTETDQLGDAGNIKIDVSKLTMQASARVLSSTQSTAVGVGGETSDAGNINVTVNDGFAVDWTNNTTFAATADLSISAGIGGFYSTACVFSGSSCTTGGTPVSGNAGSVTITTESLFANTADILTFNENGAGGSLTINAQNALLQGATYIRSDTYGTGTAGSLDFNGINGFSGGTWVSNNNQITSNSLSAATGNAGNIDINVSSFSMTGGTLGTEGVTSGNAGNISIVANDISITGGANVKSSTDNGTGTSGQVALRSVTGNLGTNSLLIDNSTVTTSTKDGGARTDGWLWLQTSGTGLITNGANIRSTTSGNGDAGPLYFQNGDWTITGSGTEVNSSQLSPTGLGDAGDIYMGVSFTSTGRELNSLVINDGATVKTDTINGGGGSIAIKLKTTGELSGGATLSANTSGTARAGDIDIGDITLNNGIADDKSVDTSTWTLDGTGTLISTNQTETDQLGDAGDIEINVNKLTLDNGAQVRSESTSTALGTVADLTTGHFEASDAGNITVTVDDGVAVDWTDNTTFRNSADLRLGPTSGISGFYTSAYAGVAGSIDIATESLYANLGDFLAYASGAGGDNTFVKGDGHGAGVGSVSINADYALIQGATFIRADSFGMGDAGSLDLDGIRWDVFNSILTSRQASGAAGDGGTINMQLASSLLLDSTTVATSTNGSGNAGDTILISFNDLTVQNGSNIKSDAEFGQLGAVAGIVGILAFNDLLIDNATISNKTNTTSGSGFNFLYAGNLGTITNNSTVTSDTVGDGDAGDVYLQEGDWIVDGGSIVSSNADTVAGETGNAGAINVGARSLTIDNGTLETTTAADALGVAGNIDIDLVDFLLLQNSAVISSSTGVNSTGRAGSITIITDDPPSVITDYVTITGNSSISSSSNLGTGNAGKVDITTDTFNLTGTNSDISTNTSVGTGGNITITANTTGNINTGGEVQSTTEGSGDAGSITLGGAASTWNINGYFNTTTSAYESQVSTSQTNLSASGNAGDINIVASTLNLDSNAKLASDTESTSTSNAGSIDLMLDYFFLNNATLSTVTKDGAGGSIKVNANTFGQIINGGTITTDTTGAGKAGNILLAGGDWEVNGIGSSVSSSQTQANQLGDAGNILIDVNTLSLLNWAIIESSTLSTLPGGGGIVSDAGTITIIADDGTDDSGIDDFYLSGGIPAIRTDSKLGFGKAGDINITAPTLFLNTADVLSQNRHGTGGTISINSDYATITGITYIKTNSSGDGVAGSINLNPVALGGSWLINQSGEITSDASGEGNAGGININVADLTITGSSKISSSSATSLIAEAGFIDVNVDDFILSNNAYISTINNNGVLGQGRIEITAITSGLIDTGGKVTASTIGSGPAGRINIDGTSWILDGVGIISSSAETGSSGVAGSVGIDVNTLTIQGGATVSTSSEDGTNDAGAITFNTQTLVMDNGNVTTINNTGANPNGAITLNTTTATLSNNSLVSASTVGSGPAGSVGVTGTSVTIESGSSITSSSESGTGDAGAVTITAPTVSLNDGDVFTVNNSGTSAAGLITLNTTTTTLDNGSQVSASTVGSGPAGNVNVIASGAANILGNSLISSSSEFGTGNAGGVTITTPSLVMDNGGIRTTNKDGPLATGLITLDADVATLSNGSEVSASTLGSGPAGSIVIDGTTLTIESASQVSSSAEGGASGVAGSVGIDVNTLTIQGGATVSTSSEDGTNDAGAITFNTQTLVMDNGNVTTINNTGANPNGAITLNTTTATLSNNSLVSASTVGSGPAGSVGIDGLTSVAIGAGLLDGSSVSSSSSSTGNAGAVDITTPTLTLNGGNVFTENTDGPDALGVITLDTTTTTLSNNSLVSASTLGSGPAGDINVLATISLDILSASVISSSSQTGTGGLANAGSVLINTPLLTMDSGNIRTINKDGSLATGVITLNADIATLSNNSEVSASTDGSGPAGSVDIDGTTLIIEGASQVSSSAETGTTGDAGSIEITVSSLTVNTLAEVATNSAGSGNAGNIDITADALSITAGGKVTSSSANGTGGAGNVSIITPLLTMNNGKITTETNDGPGGTITINATVADIGNASDITADTEGEGIAGNLLLTGTDWIIQGGSAVTSNANNIAPDAGDAGTITIDIVDSLLVTTAAEVSTSLGINSIADAGTITITAEEVTVSAGGTVASSSSAGFGNPGAIVITAGDITIDGGIITTASNLGSDGNITLNATNPFTGIVTNNSQVFTDTIGNGNAGTITLMGINWIVDGGSLISSSSTNEIGTTGGNAGVINIIPTSNFTLDGANIATNSLADFGANFGAAGNINIDSSVIYLLNNANVSSNTFSFGGGGEVNLVAGTHVILINGALVSTTTSGNFAGAGAAGDINVLAGSTLWMQNNSTLISSTFGGGDAGNINLISGVLTYLLDSTVTAEATSAIFNVGGGNLSVDTGLLVLDSSLLDVSAGSFATGGNVTLTANYFFVSPDSVIDVSSAQGAAGTVSVNAVAVDLSGGLANMNVDFHDPTALLQEACTARRSASTSSFVVNPGTGVPASPEEQQTSSPLNDLGAGENRDEQLKINMNLYQPDFNHAPPVSSVAGCLAAL